MRAPIFIVSALVASVPALAGDCPTRPVPGEQWGDRTSEARELAAPEIAALEAYAFPADLDEEARTGVRTDGLVIVRDGEILYERYGRDWTADKPHLMWSATKSIANSLLAIAVEREGVDIDASICDYVEVANPDACQITSRHLIEFSSGFAWRETYEGMSPTASSVVSMLYGEGMGDVLAFVTGHPLRDPPGTSYYYSSGDTNVMSAVAHAVLSEKYGERYPYTLLFEPLGITSALLERDGKGVPIGSSWGYMTPRDMARYGTLLLNDGCWGSDRILPEGWVERVRMPASSVHGRHVEPFTGSTPGWNVWMTRPPGIEGHDEPMWPGAPDDTFAPLGHWKQGMYVIPSENLVVARTGDDRDGESYQHGELLPLAVAIASKVPSPVVKDAADDAVEDAAEDAVEDTVEDAAEDAAERWTVDALPAAAEGVPFAEPPEKYNIPLFRIASSYAARMACDCLYVSQRSEDACKAYIKVKPNVGRIKIYEEHQTVRGRALGMAKVFSRYEGPERGCVMHEAKPWK